MSNLEQLSTIMTEDEAKQVLKITDKFDKYVKKMEKELNLILKVSKYEVQAGIAFKPKKG